MYLQLVALFLLTRCLSAQESSLPLTQHSVTSHGPNGTCPTAEQRAVIRENINQQVLSLLNSEVIPALQSRPQCPCGGPGQWTRIAHLNMSDPSQQCPSNWNLTTTPVTGCRSSIATGPSCDSAMFPSGGQQYSRVCGRVNGYQQGNTDAFLNAHDFCSDDNSLDDVCVDGVSLTHGAEGSRQHIWTFASAGDETINNVNACTCSNVHDNFMHAVPTFIDQEHYFCDTGTSQPVEADIIYTDNPLWDGKGCGPDSSCCEFNSPPWFCTTLPQPTTDTIEMRLCRDEDNGNEDIIVFLVDLYIM